ncbi:zinc finger protein NUTCRACKER-like [Iris pallida]|uniref:Zinc finger protein NUTCRACKER-like n=1 Tax=Iris pallida TaxID=29817 RepID=A0AAX6DJY2_IRIPA|nr:zinc finger protein NUTCRACKER-like [Iris pallida]
MATNRFLCEICGKGFQRDQNLQLHRGGTTSPGSCGRGAARSPGSASTCARRRAASTTTLPGRSGPHGHQEALLQEARREEVEVRQVLQEVRGPGRLEGPLEDVRTREYRCDCGTVFSRRDSFITHRAFCDALAEETSKLSATSNINYSATIGNFADHNFTGDWFRPSNIMTPDFLSSFKPTMVAPGLNNDGDMYPNAGPNSSS